MHLLVAVDLSEQTNIVLQAATKMIREANAELTLLHVGAPEPDFIGYDVGPDVVRDSVAQELRAEHRRLNELQFELQAKGITTRVLMVQGPTAEKVLSHAARMNVDCIVVGSKGRSLLGELVVGSTTRDVLRNAQVPVLVVPLSRTENQQITQ